MLKLFLDDCRVVPPLWDDDWTLCRTSEEAKLFVAKALDAGDIISVMSLDHDLGLEETGSDFLTWLCNQRAVAPLMGIHSANSVGVANMMAKIRSYTKVIDSDVKVIVYDYLDILLNGSEDLSLW